MPIITLFEDNRVLSFLRRKMYAEALALAVESESRLLPNQARMNDEDIILLVRILLLKSAALVHLKRHRDSRFAARRANQIVGLYQTRTPEFGITYDMLEECLKDLEELATIGGFIGEWRAEQAGNEGYTQGLEVADGMQHRSEAEFVDLAMTLITRLGDLAPE